MCRYLIWNSQVLSVILLSGKDQQVQERTPKKMSPICGCHQSACRRRRHQPPSTGAPPVLQEVFQRRGECFRELFLGHLLHQPGEPLRPPLHHDWCRREGWSAQPLGRFWPDWNRVQVIYCGLTMVEFWALQETEVSSMWSRYWRSFNALQVPHHFKVLILSTSYDVKTSPLEIFGPNDTHQVDPRGDSKQTQQRWR